MCICDTCTAYTVKGDTILQYIWMNEITATYHNLLKTCVTVTECYNAMDVYVAFKVNSLAKNYYYV